MRSTVLARLALLLALPLIAACGADAGSLADFFEPPMDGARDAGGGARPGSDTSGEEPELPELQADSPRPTASLRYVFVASPSLNSVAKIDSVTLAVTPIPVGRAPSIVRTVPGGDVAVVLNQGSDSISVIEAGPSSDEVRSVDVIRACNAMVLSPNGDFAVTWYDNGAARAGDRIGSLQEVSVVRLDDLSAFAISVGFHIRSVQFDETGERMFVVTDSGIHIVSTADLDRDATASAISFGDDALARAPDRQVVVDAGGHFAVLRTNTNSELRVIDLDSRQVFEVTLPAIPTDIELVSDDAVLLAALRSTGQLARVDVTALIAGETGAVVIESFDPAGPVGRVGTSVDGQNAFLYTTIDGERRVGVVPLADVSAVRWLVMEKGIRGVLASPDPSVALVVHSVDDSVEGADGLEAVVARSEGVSLLDVDSGYAKLSLLTSEPREIVFTPDGGAVFFLLDHGRDQRGEVIWLDTRSFAQRTLRMDAPAESIGVVPGTNRVFVSQRATGGRLTFIDTDDGSMRHVSAFQLNAYID